jgi:nucleoside-diphosphate-sugar epimerase
VANDGVSIHGIRVLGRLRDLPLVAAMEQIDLVVVLFPAVSRPALRELLDYCRAHSLQYRLLPTLDRLLEGVVSMHEMEEAKPEEQAVPVANSSAAAPQRNGSASGEAHAAKSESHAAKPVEPKAANGLVVAPRPDPIVLVTGGVGYVGSHLVRKLLARGYRVRVVDCNLYGRHGIEEVADHPRLELIEGDIRHLRTMAFVTKGVSRVIALAALVGDAACGLDPDETIATNFEATRLLAEVCEKAGVERVVFASSCSVYGANSELTLNEGSWLNPVSLYARTRIQSEEELLRHSGRLPVTILRLATVFGLSPRIRLDLLVNTFTAHAFYNKRIRVFGGNQWRPNLHVQDAAEAFIAAAEAPEAKVAGEIFNVGNNAQNHTVLDVANMVIAALPDATLERAEGLSDERDYRVSFDKIRHVLGFETRFTVEDGIRELAAAFAANPSIDPTDARYHNFRFLKEHGFSPAFRRSALSEADS